MAANVYECMFLLDANKVAGDIPTIAKQLQTTLEKHQAEVLASRPWDERRLAYTVKGQKKGLYYLMYFRSEGKALRPIEQDFALNETIVRSLTLKIDPKHVETMLTLARDEHALALQVANDPGDEGGFEDHRGPRRGGGGGGGRRPSHNGD